MQSTNTKDKEQALRFKRNYRKGTLRYHLSAFYLGYPLELYQTLQRIGVPNQRAKQKFVIFTSGRSGSTLLVDLINSNPTIHCDLELLKRRAFAPMQLIRTFEKCSTQDVYGFKLLSYQLKNVQTGIKDKKAFFNRLVEEEGYKLIYLNRENKAKQALSIIYAFYGGKWHNKEGSKQSNKGQFELDPAILHKFLHESELLRQFEEEMIKDQEHLYIRYDEDLKDASKHETTVQRVSDFLEISAVKPETSLRKVTPSKLSNMISNKEEVVAYLRDTNFAHYIPTLEQM